MKIRPFATFYSLTFLLLGLIPLLAFIFNNGSLDFDQAALQASEETGYEWTSNLLVVFRLILAEPILLLWVLGSAVPALAAILTLGLVKRENKWGTFWERLIPVKKGGGLAGVKLYGQIFIVLIGGLLVAYLIRQFTGGNYESSINTLGFKVMPAILIAAFLDQGAILEELGWRGFATPELQQKGINPLRVAIWVGIAWGLWHVPRDVTTGVIERLGILSYLLLYVPAFLLGTVSFSIIASYYMNKLGGSVVPAIVVHGLTNDSMGLAGKASIIEALTPYHQITKAVPFVMIAVVLILVSGSELNWDKGD